MFEQLLDTEPQDTEVKGRKAYFIISSIGIFSTLFIALIVSLFTVDLNIGMGEISMLELIAPVELSEEKLPETEITPKLKAGGPAAVATRQVNMARIDESPREIPAVISTAQNSTKERPSIRDFEIGNIDTEHVGGSGSGRGDGTGYGDENGLADGTELLESDKVAAVPPPPPPVKKDPPVKEKPIIRSMGAINGIAISLPVPVIPAAARKVNFAGTVDVKVLVDEQGRVISANAVSGNILLREASEAAARAARFTPATLSGTPVKISGVIHYHFSG